MSTLNTLFNYRTSRNTAATARGVDQLVGADRIRELRERGWIKPSATPAEVAAVEATLAAQMRARIELQEGRPWPYTKVAFFGGLPVFLLLLAAFADHGPAPIRALVLVLLWVVVAVIIGIAVIVVRRREDRRQRALTRAAVRDGMCGWCWEPAPHTLEGEITEPRVYHALAIEREIDPPPR